jgi:transcriptional regulator with GAF, ATPase, and Fis domain
VSEEFYRLLGLTRRIVGETDLDRLIPAALEVALQLSGAQRGFVLLRDRDAAPFEVKYSRNQNGEPIDPAHLDVSETVAREVAATARPVVTVDAANDDRFEDARSVLELRFNAILCVPIQERERVLGCLYLDHRGGTPTFGGEVPRMITAFADLVALALMSARRVREIERERTQLTRAKEEIAQLLAEKEDLVTDLASRCHQLETDLRRERDDAGLRFNYDHMIARAASMQPVLRQIDRVVDTELPIVIQGESGTGKEVVARTIHSSGQNRRAPFVAVNCAALAEDLLESELFGHKRGAFTGAFADRKGLFEAASGGTLFLDEVGDMSLAMQVKLLRAIQEGRIRPVGSTQEVAVQVRILAATNRDLVEMVTRGEFREDLFYRIATMVIDLPALRERTEDIPLLVRHILGKIKSGGPLPVVGGAALRMLMEYHWPGNIRQLENVVRAATVMSEGEIHAELVASLLPDFGARRPAPQARAVSGRPRKCTRSSVEEAMRVAGGRRADAARALGVSLRTLQRYLTKYK